MVTYIFYMDNSFNNSKREHKLRSQLYERFWLVNNDMFGAEEGCMNVEEHVAFPLGITLDIWYTFYMEWVDEMVLYIRVRYIKLYPPR